MVFVFTEDKRLPSVPPIALTVPEKYPDVSPQYETSSTQDYGKKNELLVRIKTLMRSCNI